MPALTFIKYGRQPNQAGGLRLMLLLCLVLAGILGIFNAYRLAGHKVPTAIPEIRSGLNGFCLDDYHDSNAANALVDSWACNGTSAQAWTVGSDSIRHAGRCLDTQGDTVVLNNCGGSSGQQWTVDLGGFENPASGLCLALPYAKTGQQLVLADCGKLSDQSEIWSADTWSDATSSSCDSDSSRGDRVACIARQQWLAWQAGEPSHQTLLANYTDGNGYEQWCADFVSYVYKQAGYPFVDGERGGGWDEYEADNIQNMGFTLHPAAGYDPQPGDVAYFDYPGGHVEIVVSGGPHPTFIYGDSGTTDPATGNGEMNEDMLTNDGSAGQVMYYLSPPESL